MLYLGAFSRLTMSSVIGTFIKPKHGEPMSPRSSVSAVVDKGLQGDASFGKPSRQVLITSAEELAQFGLEPGQIRENLTVQGIDFGSLSEGDQLQAGEAILQIVGDCSPCDFLNEIKPGLRVDIEGKRGKLATVVKGGEISEGDPVLPLVAEQSVGAEKHV